MNPIFNSFFKTVEATVSNSVIRSKVIQSALALAISNSSTMPTSPVESPANYFLMQLSQRARNIISVFNENLIVDHKAVLDETLMYWTLRYNAAHPQVRQLYSLEYGFFDGIFGVGVIVSPATYAFVNENKAPILFLTATIAEIISSLGEF